MGKKNERENWEAIGEKIKMVRIQKNIAAEELAREIKVSVSTIFRIEKGQEPGALNFGRIAKYLGVSTDYLLGLTDNPYIGLEGEAEAIEMPKIWKRIPHFNAEVSAGNGIFPDAFFPIEMMEVPYEDVDYVFTVCGDSMEAVISSGDKVLVKANPTAKPGNMVVALFDGMIVVKWFLINNGIPYLLPENKEYQPLFPEENMRFEIIGTVEHIIKTAPQKIFKDFK